MSKQAGIWCVGRCAAAAAIALIASTAALAQSVPTQEKFAIPNAEPRLHVVVLADTNDPKIGVADAKDVEMLHRLFTTNVPMRQLRFVEVTGNNARARRALHALAALDVKANHDTVIFYYSGHGAFDVNKKDHVFQPNDDNLFREDVRAAIRKLRPRLSVIISDTCSVYVRIPVHGTTGPAPGEDKMTPAFQSLFVDASGVVDISSTRPKQKALGNNLGGLFTRSFCATLTQLYDKKLIWPDVLTAVNETVKEMDEKAEQTAYAISALPGETGNNSSAGENAGGTTAPIPAQPPATAGALPGLPTAAAPHGVRLGVTATATDRSRRIGGVEVTRVLDGYPGTQLRRAGDDRTFGLVVGMHVITHVNGNAVTTYQEYSRAIDNSPQTMTLRVHNLQTGTHRDYQATLRY